MRKLIILSIFALFLMIITSLTSFASEDLRTQRTGLKEPTREEQEWMNKNFKPTRNVQLNSIGKKRILEGLKNKNASREIINQIEKIQPVPIGQETQTAESSIRTSSSTLSSNDIVTRSLPDSVDNSQSKYFPAIGDQGNEGSCGAFSTTYYQFTYMNALARDWDITNNDTSKIFSPKWTYNFVNNGIDSGSTFPDIYNVLLTNGAATWRDFPYVAGHYRDWSTDANVWCNAINYRINSKGAIEYLNTDTGLINLKKSLNDGYILTFGTDIRSWQYIVSRDDPSTTADDQYVGKALCSDVVGNSGTGHAMTIVGYNDNIWIDLNRNGIVDINEKGAFKIANSWGTTYIWGDEGFTWLSYNAIKNGAIWGNKAYWITAKSSYTPKLLAEFTLNSNLRNKLLVVLKDSNNSSYNSALYRSGGEYAFDGSTTPCDGNFVLDFTDLINKSHLDTNVLTRYNLWINQSGSTTMLKSFRIKNPQNGDVALYTGQLPDYFAQNYIGTFSIDYPTTNIVPDIPTGVTIRVPSSSVPYLDVSWTAANNAIQYNIYRSGSENGTYIKRASVNHTNFGDFGVSNGRTYYYKVSASNSVGESEKSASSSGTALPATPSGLSVRNATSTSLTISFDAVTGATGYKVFRAATSSGSYSLIASPTTTNYTNSGLSSTTTYFYKVRAINAGGQSQLSARASGTTLAALPSAPATPSGLSVGNATSTSLTISFDAVIDATGYKIFRAATSSGSYSLIASPTTTSYIDSNLSSLTTYYYKVSATNAGGEGTLSSSASGTTLATPVTGITLDCSIKTLSVRQTVQLTSTISPSNATDTAVTWTSDHPEIANVNNNGLVTALTEGSTVITATTHDGNKTATCNVTVNTPIIHVSGIRLSKTTASLTSIAQTLQLNAIITPSNATDKTVTWTTDHPNISSVNNGLVTITKPNVIVIITATTRDGNKTAKCFMHLSFPVTGITLATNQSTLERGQSFELTATLLPSPEVVNDKGISWTSSNSAVVQVHSIDTFSMVTKRILAVGYGTAVITATSSEGNFTATCTVTVVPPVNNVPVTGITLTNTQGLSAEHTLYLLRVGQTYQLNSIIAPSNATDPAVIWTSNHPEIASVNNGLVTAVAAGAGTITATTHDGNFTARSYVSIDIPVTN